MRQRRRRRNRIVRGDWAATDALSERVQMQIDLSRVHGFIVPEVQAYAVQHFPPLSDEEKAEILARHGRMYIREDGDK